MTENANLVLKDLKIPISSKNNVEFVLKFTILIALYCVFFAFIIFVVLLFLRPLTYYQTEEIDISVSSIQTIDLGRNGVISIVDSSDCSAYSHGGCLRSVCEVSITNSQVKELCVYTLKLSQPTTFWKIVINCPIGQCTVDLDSTNFSATSMFVYGDTLSMKSSSLVATNFFFDTIVGNLLVEIFKGSLASISTTKGDISIQVDSEAKLSTFSSTRNVCVTSEKGWKDVSTAIASLDDVFVEKDPATQTCFQVYSSVDRNYAKMIENNLHPVFDSLITSNFSKSSESRCVTITDLMLLKSASILPASVSQFITIKVANAEGNIFLNVIKDSSDQKRIISSPITNPVYELSNLKVSETWVDKLNGTFQSIDSEGKHNEIVFLNFGQDNDNTQDFLWVVSFSPAYLHFTPKWISIFSLYSLSSKQELFDVGLSPGLCPFFFRYEQSNEDQSSVLSSRQKIIEDVLVKFFSDIKVEPYVLILQNLYKKIQVKDLSTYPDDTEITSQLPIVALAELIYCVFLVLSVISIPKIVLESISETVQSKESSDKSKVLFLLRELVANDELIDSEIPLQPEDEKKPLIKRDANKVYPSNEPEKIVDPLDQDIEILKSYEYTSERKKQEANSIPQTSPSNPIEKRDAVIEDSESNMKSKAAQEKGIRFSQMLAHLKLRNELGNSFEHLATSGAAWIQSRFLDSLELFYSMLFLKELDLNTKISKDIELKDQGNNKSDQESEDEAETTLKLSELKMLYQLFCYYFNFPQEDILSNQSRMLLSKYKFDIQFEKKIFKNPSNEKQQEQSQLVTINKDSVLQGEDDKQQLQEEWLNTYQTFHPLINQQFDLILKELKHPANLSRCLKQAEQRIYQQYQSEPEPNLELKSFINRSKWQSSSYQMPNNFVIKSSSEIVLERQLYSQYKIDLSLKTDMYQMFKNNVLRPQNMPSDKFTQKYLRLNKEEEEEVKKKNNIENSFEYHVNKNFINRLLGIKRVNSIDTLVDQLRQVSLQIVFMISPVLFVSPEIIAVIIYCVETYKVFEGETSSTWNILFSFKNPFASLITYSCLLFIIIFFYQFIFKNMILLGRLVEVPFKVTLIRKADLDEDNNKILETNHAISKYLSPLLKILFNALIIVSVCYFFSVFSFIFMGSILVPRVQLPLVIFLGVLITVIHLQYSTFTESYETGKTNLFQRFRKNLLDKFNDFKYPKVKELTNENEKPNEEQKQSQDSVQLKKNRDSELFDLGDLQDLFESIDNDRNDQVSVKEIFDYFDKMGMRLSLQHLKQMIAHSKVANQPKMRYVLLGSEDLDQVRKKEFSIAIDHYCKLKVTQALYILDISYEVLFLTIVKIIIQSIIIGILIYSIFKGLSTAESSFDFNTNSIASLGGIIGVIFSSREEAAKALANDKLIDETIDTVEKMFHENNPLLEESS